MALLLIQKQFKIYMYVYIHTYIYTYIHISIYLELTEFILVPLLGNCSICKFNTYFYCAISCQEEGTLEPVNIAFPLRKNIMLPTIKLRRTIARNS